MGPLMRCPSAKPLLAFVLAGLVLIHSAHDASAQSPDSQSTDEILRHPKAVEASNAAVAKENAALREQIKLTRENARLHAQRQLTEHKTRAPHGAIPLGTAANGLAAEKKPFGRPLYDSAPSAPALAPINWTGFYGGFDAGWGWSNNSANLTPNDPGTAALFAGTLFITGQPLATAYTLRPSGAVGGWLQLAARSQLAMGRGGRLQLLRSQRSGNWSLDSISWGWRRANAHRGANHGLVRDRPRAIGLARVA
jgi:hypothetical protein